MKYIVSIIICVMASLIKGQAEGDYQIISSVVDNGGGLSRSADYELLGSITSDPVSPSVLNSNDYTLYGGFVGQFVDIPAVGTIEAETITANAANITGSIQSDGGDPISEQGVLYAVAAVNANPLLGGEGVIKVITPTSLGAFTVPLSGLQPETRYVIKAFATNGQGTVYSPLLALTTLSSNADLNELVFSFGEISPVFSKAETSYFATVSHTTTSISLLPTVAQANAVVALRINGGDYTSLVSGSASNPLSLNVGSNVLEIRVIAQDGVTQKIYSLNVTREKASQTISFGAIPDKLTTDAINLTATGGASGNPVTFVVTSGPGVITNNVLTFTTSGSVTITASQAGNANYLAADNVVRTFNVTKATATVTLGSLAQTFDGTPRPATVTTNPANLAVGFTYAGSSTPPTNAGSYEVLATISDLIYQGSATGTLEIGKAAQTITFAAIPDKLTTDSINLTATGGGSGNAVTFVVTSGPGVITNNVLTFTTSGSVTVTASQAGNDNYLAAEDVSRTFNVTKATATVTLGSLAQTYDGTPRTATATTDPAGLSVEFTYDGSPNPPANAGTYAVVGTINDLIYQGSATGTLEIGKASQTITFAPIPDKLTTDSVSLTATGGASGNPVTFAVTSGPGVITNNVLTFTTSGSVTVTTSQAGNANYLAADNVVWTFNVTKATATVTLGSLAQTFDGTPRPTTATTNPANLVVGFTYAGSSTPPTNAGSYEVIATINDLIYQGSATGTLEIGKASQTIIFGAIPDKLSIDSVSLTATGGASGNPVTFAVTSGPGVITNNVLTFTTSGTVAVTASQAGSDNYLPAPDVIRTFNVTKATATVTLGSLAQTYDGTPRTATATTDPAGLSVEFTYDGSPNPPANAGTYAVVGTINDLIYQGSATGTLEIGKASQTITFAPIPDKLTTDSVSLTATGGASGNPVTFAVTSGPGVITNNVLTFTTSGSVAINASQEGNANYLAAEDVVRTFTVTKAMATITLGSLAQTFNGTPRLATATTDPAGLSVEFTYDGSPNPPTNAGTYVVVGTINDLIYQGSATGTLEIGKASQAITFAPIPDKLTTDSVSLTATGGASGNPVTFAVTSGPGVITNNVLTFTTSGSVTITASQAGNANYLAAEDVSRTFIVTKATATVTLGSLAQTFVGTTRPATATTNPANLVVGFTYAGSATPPTNAGSYEVVATINDLIYQGSATGTLEIGKASQTITFAPIPDKLTTDSVSLTATGGASGNPVTFAVTSGPGVITNNVLTFTTSGSVTITASQAGNDNYLAAEDVNRSFKVLSSNADLNFLALSAGTLIPGFERDIREYASIVSGATNSITVTPTTAQANSTIEVRANGGAYVAVTRSSVSGAFALNVGTNTLDVRVTAQDGVTQKTYSLTVIRENPIQNLVVAQRPGTRLIDLAYDLDVASPVKITVEISSDGGQTFFVPAYTLTGDVGLNVAAGNGKTITWDAGADWAGNRSDQMCFRIVADDLTDGFSYIPEGPFTMGRTSGDTDSDAPPTLVKASGYEMQKTETSKSQWDEVRAWALNNGYTDLAIGSSKATNHPVHSINWYDAVKWCNALSEKEGLTPCYKSSGTVMRTGTNVPTCDWSANGYRLPTEAEWEKAARGGINFKRFPWATDVISHSHANFNNDGLQYASGTISHHPGYATGSLPYTSPVGSFAANSFGLHDVAGNVSEWTWDIYDSSYYTTIEGGTDPRGSASGTNRVLRGGNWDGGSFSCRTAFRYRRPPTNLHDDQGFRPVRSSISKTKSVIDSAEISVDSRIQQTIAFASIPDKLTTDSINLTATGGNSGNPVTFAVTSGPGVITNNILTFTTSGSVTITASQAGNDNYLAAPDVIRTFNVTKAMAPVTLASLTQTFDGTPRPATVNTNPANLAVGFTYAGSSTPPTNAGSYEVVATINDLIYQGSSTGTLEIGKAAQTITFAAIPDKLTTDSINLTATGGGSGNPVTFAVTSGPGVITNNVLTFTTSGSVTVTASQAGNDNYLAAPDVIRTFNVTKAMAPVTLASLTQTFDGTPRPATATTNPANLAVGFTYAGSSTPPTNAGSYEVLATISDLIYQGSATGTLEIGKAAQTISFAAIPDKLTTDSINLTATGGGSGNAVTFVVTSGPGVITNNVLTFTTSGSVTITASQAGNANYLAAEDVSRTFIVTKATATVTLGSLAQTFDGTPRPATATTDPAGLSVEFTYDGSPNPPANAGAYAVVGTINDLIYQGSATGTLEIGKASQAITFGAITDKLTTDSVNLTATGGDSGNPVTFAVTSGPGLITNNILTFTTSGSVTITASQAGNANYLAAEDVVRTFTVTKAVAPLAFTQLTQVANGTPRPVSVSTTPSGLTVTTLYAGSPTAPSLPGSYTVTSTIEDPIYQGTASASLTVLGLTGLEQPLLSGSTSPLANNGTDYGNVTLGRVLTRVFTLSNPGSQPVTLSGNPLVEVEGDHAGDFQVSVLPEAVIPAGGSVSFELRFAPTQPGARTAQVKLASATIANGPITFAVQGFGALPAPRPQTITFAPLAMAYLSQSPLQLLATASSGLPVSLQVISGPATLSQDGLLTLSSAGTVRVEARQAGNGSFAAAPAVLRTITVKADPTTLTLVDLIKTYNGQPQEVGIVGAPASEVTVTYRVGTTFREEPPVNAGSYAVRAVAGAVTKTGTLVINPAPLVVTAENKRRLVGEDNPPITLLFEGFIGEDTLDSVLERPITRSTTATKTSPVGSYPITSSGGVVKPNYRLVHRPGTLVVEGVAGSYEALLRHPTSGLPNGHLALTVPGASRTFTATLRLGQETAPIAWSGSLLLSAQSRLATATVTRLVAGVAYELKVELSLFGELSVEVRRAGELVATAEDGIRLLTLATGQKAAQEGMYTAILEPARPAALTVPAGAGWATGRVDARGQLTLTGRLGDGTSFTASLAADVAEKPGYRLFVQPYVPARRGSHLGGSFTLVPHPRLAARSYVAGSDLSWVKVGQVRDLGYRTDFGPVTTTLRVDPWQAPSTTHRLATRLELGANGQWEVEHSDTGSSTHTALPTWVGVSATNVVTPQANTRKWRMTLTPSTGAYTGSFELLDVTQIRTVNFSGVLRQTPTLADDLIGAGHYLLPALKTAPSNEQRSGAVLFWRN